MSRGEGGIDGTGDVDDEFTKQAKDAANAHAAQEDLAEADADTDKDKDKAGVAKSAAAKSGVTTSGTKSSKASDGAAKKTSKKAAAEADTKTDSKSDSKTGAKAASKADAEGDSSAVTKRSRREKKPPKVASGLNPTWWVPVMVGLMVLGLIWLVVFYLSGAKFPIPGISYWNLAIGFALMMAGFAMTTRWK